MSKTKISQLPEKSPDLSGSAVSPWSDNGTTYKYTYTNLKNQILKEVYPVGAVIFSASLDTVAKVQSQYGGTWVRTAEGRAVFGYSASDGNFNSNLKTGGSNTHTHSTSDHTLTSAEIPSHQHGLVQGYGAPTGATSAWPVKISTGGSSSYTVIEYNKAYSSSLATSWVSKTQNTGDGGAHNHGNTGSTGSLPQYITMYAYRRTA